MRLTTHLHETDVAGLTYVYPVVSRRAGGVSVGINLNPNKACNFRCVYCQVEGLVAGNAPAIDLDRLERELRAMLDALVRGDYLERHVDEGLRTIRDLAICGDGEPTSAREFDQVVELAVRVRDGYPELAGLPLVLITNGSLVQRPEVQRGLELLGRHGGQAWFKLDSATEAGQERLNHAHLGLARVRRNLLRCAELCPTWVQTCALRIDGEGPDAAEQEAYRAFLRDLLREGVALEGVLLYGLARPSHQPEAPRLAPLPAADLHALGDRIAELGLTVRVSP